MMNLSVDSARLQHQIDELASYSDAPEPAVTRILFTETELQARAFVRGLMQELGLTVREDAVGNIFGRWQGTQADLPPVATGSHIDAIPFSGKFDGTVGVLGALEAIRALQASGYTPRRSIEVIMFTAEEPTRFGIGCLGSRALAGNRTPDDLRQLNDAEGKAFDEVRTAAGYDGDLADVQLPPGTYSAFVELHIEQGSRLEEAGIPLGIVTAIAAPATLRVIVHGEGGHAGTVLMPQRKDALTASAEIVLAVESCAHAQASANGVATVGLFEVYPGAVNSIPSRVLMEIDIRDVDLAARDALVEDIQENVLGICERRGLQVEMTVLNADPPCTSGDQIITALTQSADELGYESMQLVSRAYHDALFMAQICPAAMIFVPSEHGYSHRPEEYSSPEEIAKGVELLAAGLQRLSQG